MGDDKTAREQRLAAALRANLLRRKQQARERAEVDAPQNPEDTASESPCSGGKH